MVIKRGAGRFVASLFLAGAWQVSTTNLSAFDRWTVREIYSDSSGAYQFIEFFTTSGNQQYVNTRTIAVTPLGGGGANIVALFGQLPGDSANRTFLVGTAGITNFGAPLPDFIVPSNFLFIAGATINYFGQDTGGSYSMLPTNGILSRNWVSGTDAVNSPQNFAGQTGTIVFNVPPEVAITSPATNALFGVPDPVSVSVTATDTNGLVTHVRLLTNGVLAASNAVAPFGFVLTNLAAGNYSLHAVAEDNGFLTGTSAPVTVRVVNRPRLVFSPGLNGPLSFQFQSATGVNYVVERGLPFTNFTSVATNAGSGGIVQFSETNRALGQATYRVQVR